MKKQTRMIKSIIEEAAKIDVVMPWARGARRTAWIAKRANLINGQTAGLKALHG